MVRKRRTIILAVFCVVNVLALALYLSYGHESSYSREVEKISKDDLNFATTHLGPVKNLFSGKFSPDTYQRENATMVTLCRNSDLESVTKAIMSVEYTWNWKYGYPYIFVNNEEFTDEFKSVVSSLVREAYFEVVPEDQWQTPEWIDEEKAAQGREFLSSRGIPYGDSVPYRHMCRFFSGFFYRTPMTSKYKYILRLDNDVMHLCKLSWDPFRYMRETGTKYGFTIALYEFHETIETLWEDTLKFAEKYPEFIHPHNMARFVTEDHGNSYNNCHFWSNFELVDADFFRGEAYSKYFEYLDKLGGFYYERWGDAPVHSLAASLFLSRDEIHFFESMGYIHKPFGHLPDNFVDRGMECYAAPGESFDTNDYSCLRHYLSAEEEELPSGVNKVYF